MSEHKSAIALGFFDGVHLAHQRIISRVVSYAQCEALSPVVLTFDRSPLEILAPEKARYIMSNAEKKKAIVQLGANAEFLHLTKELLGMPAEDFVKDILVGKYNIKYAVCGYNYRFGCGGNGDTDLLCAFGEKYGFKTEVCDCVALGGETVSSSRIKELISLGRVREAGTLLGKNFAIEGEVCHGKHLGRTMGFPTANVFLDDLTVIPKNGVYKTRVTVNAKSYDAITNTGVNPTVGGEKLRTETYIPALSENLYGKNLRVEFVDFIRSEMKFNSLTELKKQIESDVSALS